MRTKAQTAFFSYSRDDSEFALRLAEDLKTAGANVWLDQLDIAPGQRWARAVQDALNDCHRLLVILSPSSVNSTNVDDEVAFALGEHKTVIPVLHRDCKVPFQLRPFQNIDFRTDYDRALKVLLKALAVGQQAVAAGEASFSGVLNESEADSSIGKEHKIKWAELSDGRALEYVVVPDPPEGGMKCTYFAPDRSYVVQFYHEHELSKDPSRRARLEKILSAHNPTIDSKVGAYWRNLFCWPTSIVVNPRLGVVCPTYRPNFFFQDGPFKGKEKDGLWFVLERPRRMLSEEDRGTWINYFQICILLARAVRRLHSAGLAHADLNPKNILIDPSSGQITVIGIDSLVVPGIFPPDVIGTTGYMAPEVLTTCNLPIDDPGRNHASTAADLHTLAVMIYEYLLQRHPLRGPKVHSTFSETDEHLAMGKEALFIEHPTDSSNRPTDLKVPFRVLGPLLSDLVEKAFVSGLHRPEQRPNALAWERALCRTWDLMVDCENPGCPNKWFIFDPNNPVCPFCSTRRRGSVPVLRLSEQYRHGQWKLDSELVAHHNLSLFSWHAMDNVFPGERADRMPLAYCTYHQGQWLLVNRALPTLSGLDGRTVRVGEAIALTHGAVFRFSDDPHGRQAEVHIVDF